MIYINKGNSYTKYYITRDGRLICMENDGTEQVLLYDVSDEFDACISEDGNEHFIIQGLNGELIYLKKEKDTWKKYCIFKSRRGVKKISGIKLIQRDKFLCAFYIMEHTGRNLLIKHLFSAEDLYREPEVLSLTDKRKDFSVCENDMGEIHLFYKNEKGKWTEYIFQKDGTQKSTEELPIEEGILNLCGAFIKNELCFLYTVQRGKNNALVFARKNNLNDFKTVTFGISKTCRPEIISYDEFICIQWSENGAVMQSDINENSGFTKPKPIGVPGVIARIRENKDSGLKCQSCAVYNKYPYIPGRLFSRKENKGDDRMNIKNDIINDKYSKEIINKLKEIEADIQTMGKNLDDMCLFLSELQDFKNNISNPEISIAHNETKTALSGGDVGEVDEKNIKLFESTDIDSVLPE